MKRCSRCGEAKATTDFYKDKRTKSGLQSECKSCHNRDVVQRGKLNKDEKNRRLRDWRKANPDKRRKHEATYRQAHPDYTRVKYQTRKARESASGVHTTKELEQIKHEQFVGGHIRCFYCGSDVDTNYQIEHVVPVSRGGSNTIDNIVLACPPCNQSKGSKLLSEWEGR